MVNKNLYEGLFKRYQNVADILYATFAVNAGKSPEIRQYFKKEIGVEVKKKACSPTMHLVELIEIRHDMIKNLDQLTDEQRQILLNCDSLCKRLYENVLQIRWANRL